MEKRLLLSVFLSLLVLYIWAGFVQKPSPINNLKGSQVVDNKIDKINTDNLSDTTDLNVDQTDPRDISKDEELITLENDQLLITLSNIGGTIKEVFIKEYNERLPITQLGGPSNFKNYSFRLDKKSDKSAEFSLEVNGESITSLYELEMSGYVVNNEIKFFNKLEMSKQVSLDLNSFTIDPSRMDISNDNDKSLFEYAVSSYEGVLRKNNAFKFSNKENRESASNVIWSAYRNRYFCAINKPDTASNGYKIASNEDGTLSIVIKAVKKVDFEGKASFSSLFFVGPERFDLLSSYNLGLEKVKKFYRFGLFDLIAMAIYRLMYLIYKVIPNWGVSIVLISIIIYFSMYPLTLRGMSSMKKMQALQPEIAKLKEKYSDNPQKMNQETMRIYKDNKINPMGGCLPFLLQMPVFIGLYQVLWRSVSFKGASFLWIKDLSEPDRILTLKMKLPFIGDEINFLPILMMVIMFFQQKLTSKNMSITDPIQKQQQKMMGILMPVFLGAIFYKFASGLTLYFTLFYLFSTVTQLHMYSKKGV